MRSAFPLVAAASLLALLATTSHAFSPLPITTTKVTATTARHPTELHEIIRALTDDDKFSDGLELGGVKLALESAIKIDGTVSYKPGSADAQPTGLFRYKDLTKLSDESAATSVLDKVGAKVIARGFGVENYVDPGKTTEKIVYLSSVEAVKDAVATAASAQDFDTIVLNFLGGDDLIMHEVCDAAEHFALHMDIPTKTKIIFHSLCHSTIKDETCSVCVVGIKNKDKENEPGPMFVGAEKTVATGEVYFYKDTWYTLQQSDFHSKD